MEVRVGCTEDLAADELAQIRRLMTDAFDDEFSQDDWDHTLGGWHIVATDAQSIVRTSHEDDGIMVLRCAATADIDLGGSICCSDRSGDDW
jgi:hypothetical protein